MSILHGVEIPPYGGDTIWYNSVLAYESLSSTMKSILSPLRVHMSAQNVIGSMKALAQDSPSGPKMSDMELELDVQSMLDGSYHPLIRKHPVSGEVSLYCDAVYAVGLEGMTDRESRPLLEFLVAHLTQEMFSCRLRWEPHTVAVWDNRICLHRAFNDYDGYRREMHRTTVKRRDTHRCLLKVQHWGSIQIEPAIKNKQLIKSNASTTDHSGRPASLRRAIQGV